MQSGVLGGKGGTILATSLNGANEVPVQGGPAVGDRDGAALEFVKVEGSKVSVAVKWRGTGKRGVTLLGDAHRATPVAAEGVDTFSAR